MSRAPRIEFEGALYHVMTRGGRGEPIFLEDQDRLRFLQYLDQGTDRYGVLVHCYVLMGNHFQLLVTTPKADLSKWMHHQWSSYRGYAGLGKQKRFVRSGAIERAFKTHAGQEWKPIQYRRWVEEGLLKELDDPFEALKWQQVLGRENVLQQIKDRWNQKENKPPMYSRKRAWSAELDAKEIVKTVGKYFGSKPAEILERGRRNSAAGRCAMALCWDFSGLSHREISEMFGTPSSNAVAQMIRRSKEKENRTLKILRGKLSHK